MNELLAKLKRLFQPSPRPSESVGEATADRPPPPAVEPPPRAAEPLPVEPTPARETASVDADDLAEVRAALDAVAAAPVATHPAEAEPAEPEAFEPEPAEPEPTERIARVPVLFPEPAADEPAADVLEPAPDRVPASAPEPFTPAATTPETVDVPAQAVGRVGDALVLTLGTPPVTFTVAKTSATLGRGQENTIRLDDLSVSRRHARIAYRQGGYWISDLGSMGGTWVEGTRLNAPRRLAAGEVIDIGLLRLTVGFAGGAAKAETKNTKPRSEIAGQVRRRR